MTGAQWQLPVQGDTEKDLRRAMELDRSWGTAAAYKAAVRRRPEERKHGHGSESGSATQRGQNESGMMHHADDEHTPSPRKVWLILSSQWLTAQLTIDIMSYDTTSRRLETYSSKLRCLIPSPYSVPRPRNEHNRQALLGQAASHFEVSSSGCPLSQLHGWGFWGLE